MYKIFYEFFQTLTAEQKKKVLIELYSNCTSPAELIKQFQHLQ